MWSTGFVGARYGLPYAEPFVFLTIRMVAAAILLAILAAALRQRLRLSRDQWTWSAAIGVLLHACYLGGVFWAISRGLPVSVSALVVSTQPVLVAVLASRLLGERLTRTAWCGIALGAIGVVLVLEPGVVASQDAAYPPAAIAAVVIGLLGSTAATLMQKKVGAGIPMLSGTAVQYAASAIVFLVLALATESWFIDWTPAFVGALTWLILVLSIGAVLLMFWLLRNGTAARMSSLYFLVPPVTLVEAYVLFGERLPLLSLVGFAVATAGVALVQRRAA